MSRIDNSTAQHYSSNNSVYNGDKESLARYSNYFINDSFHCDKGSDDSDAEEGEECKFEAHGNWLAFSQANISVYNQASEKNGPFTIKLVITRYEFASLRQKMVSERIKTFLRLYNTNHLLVTPVTLTGPRRRNMKSRLHVVRLSSLSIQTLVSAAAQHCRILTEETSHANGHARARLVLSNNILFRLFRDSASRLRSVEKKTGATILIEKKNLLESGERVIHIRGALSEVKAAIEMIYTAGFTIANQWNLVAGRDYEEFDVGPDWKEISLGEAYHGRNRARERGLGIWEREGD